MEAIALRQEARRCNNQLIVGNVYLFKNVGFDIFEFAPPFGLFIPMDHYLYIDSRTEIRPSNPNHRISKLPSRFVNFRATARVRNKSIIGS